MLGYIAYTLICLFGPIQLYSMVRGRNINLGILPLASLTIGLWLLQISIVRDGAPGYIYWGNLAAAVFNTFGLFWDFCVTYADYRRDVAVSRLLSERYALTEKGVAATEKPVPKDEPEGDPAHKGLTW